MAEPWKVDVRIEERKEGRVAYVAIALAMRRARP